MSGLGISGFIKHNDAQNSSRGQWLKQWKKNGKGEICIWLHTRAPIVPCHSHSFMLEDEYEDKETGRAMPTLRYPRFVSPDPEPVHKSQYFRNDDDTLQVPPDLDPFLLLREWLRFADHLSLDQPIFQWNDPKNRETITWYRGELSGLEKRGKKNFGHSLDTKLEYIYVVLDNDDIETGPVLAREGKLLSQKISEVIKQQVKMLGDEGGDPQQHPYAFQWVAEDAASPMNAYKAFKREDAQFTDEVWAQISSDDFPDPVLYGTPGDGDMEKIRDAMAAAAQVELPLDEIFSEDSAVRRSLTRPLSGTSGKRAPARMSKAAQARAAATAAREPATPALAVSAASSRQARPAPVDETAAAEKPASAPRAAAQGPQQRRRKVEPPPPPLPPGEDTIPCDECGTPMLEGATVCDKCGAEYEVDSEQPPPPAPPAKAAPAKAPPKPGAPPKPTAAAAAAPAAEGEAAENCWSCGADLNGHENCPSCGIDQGDDIPF